MTNTFYAISLSHNTAPVQIREQFALTQEQLNVFALHLKDVFNLQDVLVLSTCNRTEIYYNAALDYSLEILHILSIRKQISKPKQYFSYFLIFENQNAVTHLFKVAAGLDSKIKGDLQITNQLKAAYQTSIDLDLAGPFLHRLLHTIFSSNKRIANETCFRDGTATVPYHALKLATELCKNINKPKLLVLGLGEIGQNICKYFDETDNFQWTIMTRTIAKARALATEKNMNYELLENIETAIEKADVIISSLNLNTPLFWPEINKNNNKFKFFIDLAVPRSIDVALENQAGVLVYNIEQIQAKIDQTLEIRLSAIPQVESIIEQSIDAFSMWKEEFLFSPIISKFKTALEVIRKEELSRQIKHANSQEIELIDTITKNIIQKIIKLPVVHLKSACKKEDTNFLLTALSELFDLEKISQLK